MRTSESIACVGLFGAWVLATALVYRFPGVAVWVFSITGVIGRFVGVQVEIPARILWELSATVSRC